MTLLQTLLDGGTLGAAGGRALVAELPDLPEAVAGAILGILSVRGVEPATLGGIAAELRERALDPGLPVDRARPLVDTCGTGGDGSHSLNLSTGAAFLTAACGLQVAKHGNRSISSRSGSSDVLSALGLGDDTFRSTGFAYLHAPSFHPAMARLAPVRRALGVRTVFNLVGPLCNPARPTHQVLGVARAADARIVAEALAGLGGTAFVVHGLNGWDEATPAAPFLCLHVADGTVTEAVRDPAEAGLRTCADDDLRGSSATENARRLAAALGGGDTLAHRDALCLGAGLALEVTQTVGSLAEGVAAARTAIASGRAASTLEALREVAHAG